MRERAPTRKVNERIVRLRRRRVEVMVGWCCLGSTACTPSHARNGLLEREVSKLEMSVMCVEWMKRPTHQALMLNIEQVGSSHNICAANAGTP